MSPQIVYYAANGILYLFWCLSVNLVCERRFSWKLMLPLECASAVLYELITDNL